jgi:hypothetical protein
VPEHRPPVLAGCGSSSGRAGSARGGVGLRTSLGSAGSPLATSRPTTPLRSCSSCSLMITSCASKPEFSASTCARVWGEGCVWQGWAGAGACARDSVAAGVAASWRLVQVAACHGEGGGRAGGGGPCCRMQAHAGSRPPDDPSPASQAAPRPAHLAEAHERLGKRLDAQLGAPLHGALGHRAQMVRGSHLEGAGARHHAAVVQHVLHGA